MGDLVVGARSGREEPEGQDSSVNDATGENDVSADDKYGSTEPGASGGSGDPGDPPAGAEGKDGQPAKKPRSFWKELPILVLIALILAMLIKSFLLQAFSIPSASMQNTLQEGDRVLVDKLTPWFGSEPVRGEVVVFHDPGGWLSDEPTASPNVVQQVLSFIGLMPSAEEKDLIKRVIAVGGDTVECKRGGKVKVNGVALDESSYLYPGNTPCDDMPFGPLKVPKGHIWVLGDHRQDSRDSRYNQTGGRDGTVPVSQVVGRAVVVAWPVNRWAVLSVPSTFDQSGINNQASAAISAPDAVALMGAVPLVFVRRRKLSLPA